MKDKQFVVVVPKGSFKQPKTKEDMERYQKEEFKETDYIATYIAKQKKDNETFMNLTADLTEAQSFASQAQAQAIADYIQALNKDNNKQFDVLVEELIIKTKGVK